MTDELAVDVAPAPDATPARDDPSGSRSPAAGTVGALTALQRMVGNRTVARGIQRHPGPHPGPDGHTAASHGTANPAATIAYRPEDPLDELITVEGWVAWMASLDFEGVDRPEELSSPVAILIQTRNKTLLASVTGRIHEMTDTGEAGVLADERAAFIVQTSTGEAWQLFREAGISAVITEAYHAGDIRSGDDVADIPAGQSFVLLTYPSVTLTAREIRRVEAMIRDTEAAMRRAAGPSRRDRRRLEQVIERRSGRTAAPESEDDPAEQPEGGTGDHGDGPGSGREGDGRGGGGEAEDGTATERVTDPSLPLQGEVKLRVKMSRRGYPQIEIEIEGVTTSVPMRRRDSVEDLDERIDEAIDQLQQEWDPDLPRAIEGAATATEIQAGPDDEVGERVDVDEAHAEAEARPGRTIEGERLPGAPGLANAPQYPSSISMAGYRAPAEATVGRVMVAQAGPPAPATAPDGAEAASDEADAPDQPAPEPAPRPAPTIAQDVQAPTTTKGATNRFTMNLDYAAQSISVRDEVFNRLQSISFYWELLEVPDLTAEQAEARSRQVGVGGEGTSRTRMGQSMDIERSFDDIAEDQRADMQMMADEQWPWEARAAYLGVIGVSNTIRAIGTLISSYVSLITQPRCERSIGFDEEGIYLLRCIATPEPSEEALADPDHHVIRMSSVAVMPIRVLDLGRRADETLGQEDRDLAELERELANASTPEERRLAELKLRAFRTAQRRGAAATFRTAVGGIRDRLRIAEALDRHHRDGVSEDAWGVEEIELEIGLLSRGVELAAYLTQLRAQLEMMGGRGATSTEEGRHEEWVGEQLRDMRSEYRPRIVLASQENGQVTPVNAMLGEAGDSTDDRQKWALVDISSPGSAKKYTGESTMPGEVGRGQAIRAAFRDFAANNQYGRGTIAIRLPDGAPFGPTVQATVPTRMRSAPGDWSRATQRLNDLAAAAAIAGMFVTGPLGAAVGFIGGLPGVIMGIDSLIERAQTGHFWEIGTIFDIVGIVGGLAAVGGAGTAIARMNVDDLAAATRPAWVQRLERTERALQIHGHIDNALQIIQIPYQAVEEIESIQRQLEAGGLSPGEARARGALAILRALKDGSMTMIGMTHEGGIDPFAPRPDAPDATSRTTHPDGFRADHAERVADGTADPLGPTPAETTGGDAPRPADAPASRPDESARPESADRLPQEADLVAEAQRRAELTRQRADAAATAEGRAAESDGATPTDRNAPGGRGADTDHTPAERIARAGAVVDSLAALAGRLGPEPPPGEQRARPRAGVADPDATRAIREAGNLGDLRRHVDAMESLTGPQRAALQARLQEARAIATHEQVTRVLQSLQSRFPDLTFSIQDFGTPGFNSDADLTIRATPADPAAYARSTGAERQAIDRRMIQASAEAVPLLYAALDAAGLPADRALDTNFYTELHEGRLQPADDAERTQIVADQEVVALTELALSLDESQWSDYVGRQRERIAAIDGLSDRERAAVRRRFDEHAAAAADNATRLRGPRSRSGGRSGDRASALQRARDTLVAAAMREPPASAREMRQLMADVKLLEPDAYGTRSAMEGVVLGGQQMRTATMEQVREEGFRTRRQIERGLGEPGPLRLDPDTGQLVEPSAEQEVARRRREAAPHVGRDRGGTREASAFERNATALNLARAVLGHLVQHGAPTHRGVSGAAKNLGRIAGFAHDAGVARATGGGFSHLPDIIAAKGSQHPLTATRDALRRWAGESDVASWADGEGHALATDSDQLAAFIAWSQHEGARLVDALETRTDTAHLGDSPTGAGQAAPPPPPVRRPAGAETPAPDETAARDADDGTAERPVDEPAATDDADVVDRPEIIDEMVGMPPEHETFDRTAMEAFFVEHIRQNPHLEVSLVRNTETGQMVVVQGNASRVTYARLVRAVHELVGPEHRGRGRWVVESHSHAVDGDTGTTPLADRAPSLVDIAGVATEAQRRGARAEEQIVITTGRGRETIIVGFEPGHAEPIAIDLARPDGARERLRFADIESYAEWYQLRFGADPGQVPGTYAGPRRADPDGGRRTDTIDERGVVRQTADDEQFTRQEYFDEDRHPSDPDAPHTPRYHADSRLSSDGTLTMDFSLRVEQNGEARRSASIRGRGHFEQSLDHFRSRRGEDAVRRIVGHWGDGDNLAAFRARHRELTDLGMNDADARLVAASETFTGRWAIDAGFGRISEVTIGDDGVRATFEPGPSNIPDVPRPGDATTPPTPRSGNRDDTGDGRDTIPSPSPSPTPASDSGSTTTSGGPAPRHHATVRAALEQTFDRGMPPPEQFVQALTLDEYIATWRSHDPEARAGDDPPGPAYFDRVTRRIYMDNGVQPATVAHEALHALTHDAFFSAVPTWLNEGVTELLTADAIGRPAADTDYRDNVTLASALRDLVGADVLRAAYFDGDIAGLASALDRATGRDGTLTLLRNLLPTDGTARADPDLLRVAHEILAAGAQPLP